MKRISFTVLVLLAMLGTTGAVPAASAAASDNFFAVLSGGDEVPARDTIARGVATFKLNQEGTGLDFTLIAANIDNVVAAHIHCGAPGVIGPVGVGLFGGAAGTGRFDGVLATGTITTPIPANACGWVTLADLLTALRSGNTYVNVHTNDGIAPPNTGPGDFPGGEIRGQVR